MNEFRKMEYIEKEKKERMIEGMILKDTDKRNRKEKKK